MLRNHNLIEKTVEITVARMTNTNIPPCKEGGENVAEFMQEIYNKLVELNNAETN